MSRPTISARYDLDRGKGIFSRPSHKLAEQSYVDRILVLDTAKGGVATAWMLHEMRARGIVPRGLIFNRVNPILAQGAAFGDVALVDRFDGDVTQLFRTGDDQHKVDLDTPVIRYIPDLRLNDPRATQAVTLRQLLSHTSGLPPDEQWPGQVPPTRGTVSVL